MTALPSFTVEGGSLAARVPGCDVATGCAGLLAQIQPLLNQASKIARQA